MNCFALPLLIELLPKPLRLASKQFCLHRSNILAPPLAVATQIIFPMPSMDSGNFKQSQHNSNINKPKSEHFARSFLIYYRIFVYIVLVTWVLLERKIFAGGRILNSREKLCQLLLVNFSIYFFLFWFLLQSVVVQFNCYFAFLLAMKLLILPSGCKVPSCIYIISLPVFSFWTEFSPLIDSYLSFLFELHWPIGLKIDNG